MVPHYAMRLSSWASLLHHKTIHCNHCLRTASLWFSHMRETNNQRSWIIACISQEYPALLVVPNDLNIECPQCIWKSVRFSDHLSMYQYPIILCSVLIAIPLFLLFKSPHQHHPLPPGMLDAFPNAKSNTHGSHQGPRPLPFIGNLHQVPRNEAHRIYNQWARLYGSFVQFLLGYFSSTSAIRPCDVSTHFQKGVHRTGLPESHNRSFREALISI